MVSTKDESRDFMSVFPDIVRDLTETGRHLDIPDATKWFAKVSIVVRQYLYSVCLLILLYDKKFYVLVCNIQSRLEK